MDKQIGEVNEMVEEMAKGMCEHCIENEEFTCSIAPQPCVFAKTFAENLYNAGYRKIPENAVVLTKEELAQIQSNFFDAGIKHGGKETAEKFAEMAKELLDKQEKGWSANMIWIITAKDCIDETCKEIKGEKL